VRRTLSVFTAERHGAGILSLLVSRGGKEEGGRLKRRRRATHSLLQHVFSASVFSFHGCSLHFLPQASATTYISSMLAYTAAFPVSLPASLCSVSIGLLLPVEMGIRQRRTF